MNTSILLAVDDKPDNLYVLKSLIAQHLPDCLVLTASSAEEGLAAAAENDLDGVLVDVQMPGTNGIEMCRQLKSNERTAHVPVILITAHRTGSKIKAKGLEVGADDFLTKPIDNVELMAKIKVMLRIKRSEDRLRDMNAHLDQLVAEKTQALQASEERLRQIADTIEDVFWITDWLNHKTLFASQAYEKIWGRSLQDLYADARNWSDAIHPEDRERAWDKFVKLGETDLYDEEYRIVRPDGSIRWVHDQGFPVRDMSGQVYRFAGIARDITERKQTESERETTIELLRVLSCEDDLRELMRKTLCFMQELSGCEAIGIRLRDGDDFPYFETKGFSGEFVEAERHLCVCDLNGQLQRDEIGNPVLECMCGNIICGRFDPSKPFFTDHGSFMSNCTSELLTSTTEKDRQSRTRNRCNAEGYESVLLIPLRVGSETLGLMQFNDRRKGCFSHEFAELAEGLADSVAIALAQRGADEELEKHREHLEERVWDRTEELRKTVNLMAGRENRMAELKRTIKKLRAQLEEAGMTPVADDPLQTGRSEQNGGLTGEAG